MSTDRDEDTVLDADDNCPTFVNPGQEDSDSDETGNSCDADDDNDGVPDTHDTFPLDSNLSGDLDGDGIDNIIDTDDDGDGLLDAVETNTYGTDPFNADTDLDGSSDGAEITAGTDPLDPASTPPIADGDVNGDGQVNVADLINAIRIITGLDSQGPSELLRWDIAPLVNGVPVPDSQNNVADYLIIQRKILGLVSF
jgi:hypothetical protein